MELTESRKGVVICFVFMIGFFIVCYLTRNCQSIYLYSLHSTSSVGTYIFFLAFLFYGIQYLFDKILPEKKEVGYGKYKKEND